MKRPSWLVTLLLAGGVIALMLAFAAEGIGNAVRDLPPANAYNTAPACPPGETTSATGAPCRAWVEAVIIQRLSEGAGGRYTPSHYYLDLRLPGDDSAYVELPDTDFPWGGLWNEVREGEVVQVELWQGSVTHVRAGSRTEPTSDDPLSRGLSSLPGCLFLAPYALVVVVIIVAALNLDRLTALAARRAPPETKRENGS